MPNHYQHRPQDNYNKERLRELRWNEEPDVKGIARVTRVISFDYFLDLLITAAFGEYLIAYTLHAAHRQRASDNAPVRHKKCHLDLRKQQLKKD